MIWGWILWGGLTVTVGAAAWVGLEIWWERHKERRDE